jgi:predicted nucleic acid-binding protein
MPFRAIDVSKYEFSEKDEVLFDANVWLFIYGTYLPPNWAVSAYSDAYSHALSSKCRIHFDILVASEFVNRYARLIHNLFTGAVLGTPADFKEFRGSQNFKEVAQQISADLRQIFKHSQRTESGFPGLDINAILNSFERGGCDFNDYILAELCRTRNLTLVTHDKDFKGLNVTVLTANKKLLA